MANFLLAATPMPGHADPVIAIAAGLVQRGHRVRVLTGSLFQHSVERAGAEFIPLAAEVDIDYRNIDARFPERATIPPGAAQMLWGVRHLFADAIAAQCAGLRAVMSDWHVDAILADMMFLGTLPLLLGPRRRRPVIAHLGISTLALSAPEVAFFGSGLPPARTAMQRTRNAALNQYMQEQVFASLQGYVNGVLAACGAAHLPAFLTDAVVKLPDAYLQIGVQALEYSRSTTPPELHFIGVPPAPAATFDPPDWWPDIDQARRDGRPVCLVTQGTIASRDLGQLIVPTMAGLGSMDALLIAITSGADPAALADHAPDNTRLARFVPYSQILPRVDLLVTNGGFGGVLLALSHGVPLIVAGDSEEKPEIAARVAHAGVGIDLATGRPAPELIAVAAREVLSDPNFRSRARAVARSLGELDSIAITERVLTDLSRRVAA